MRLILYLAMFISLSACEQRTVVNLEGGNPPRFSMSGSGTLAEAIIFGPEQEQVSDPFDTRYAIWHIVTEEGRAGAYVRDLGSITYGVVPQGYKQIIPERTKAPAALTPGKRYRYWFVTGDAPNASGYFEIREGKAVSVKGP
jgi:hypothetical protein